MSYKRTTAYKVEKSSALKCVEHILECLAGFHSARVRQTNSIHLFRLRFASGRSSPSKGMACKGIRASLLRELVELLQPYTAHLSGMTAEVSSVALCDNRFHDSDAPSLRLQLTS